MAHMKEQHPQANQETADFKDTLNLPHTDFPIRANAAQDDPLLCERWQREELYTKAFYHNQGSKKFILHDGPPYANGNIHLGHAYNKILKDIVTKARRMVGFQVSVTPGWDCHGLPIEFKVSQEDPTRSPAELIAACKEYAAKWIEVQKAEFKRLGVIMDWNRPYITMDPTYEADTIHAFGMFVTKGYIHRSNKTVPWCPSCKTVLASAEIEYEERKDPSIYVLFMLEKKTQEKLFANLTTKPLAVAVWTTTPWTLPLNRAVLIKPDEDYSIIDMDENYIMVGAQRAEAIIELVGRGKVVASCKADQLLLENPLVSNPITHALVPLLADASVLTQEGTAFVHCAPGAGPLDYEVGIKNGLEIYSPINEAGCYADKIIPTDLRGKSITDGQSWVLIQLQQNGTLLHKGSIKHSYPHCWRCHGPLLFRATKQWFLNLAHNNLKEKVLQATNGIATVPENTINRLQATIGNRLEWCISRQRIWGVPIPAVICTHCDHSLASIELIEFVAQETRKHGIAYWQNASLDELLPKDFRCPHCKKNGWKKEKDILDVWFDSGISHFAVLEHNTELNFPADVYLEGKDQHRGWFQSSLLTSVGLEGKASMKTLITHGYTVDSKGRKMSKSLGNVVSPEEVIKELGTDGLRLWAASSDLASDPVVSPLLITYVKEAVRKIRNTSRFFLSNLYDFSYPQDQIEYRKLRLIDKLALHQLAQMQQAVLHDYETYNFTNIMHTLNNFVVNISNHYLEMIKDHLYVELPDGLIRRSAQTTCYHMLDTITRLIAPVLSFTAEQISDHYQKDKKQSIHLQSFAQLPAEWDLSSLLEKWRVNLMDLELTLASIAKDVMYATELLREQKIIKRSIEAKVHFSIMPHTKGALFFEALVKDLHAHNESEIRFLKDWLLVSQVSYNFGEQLGDKTTIDGISFVVQKAEGAKCPRCWQWDVASNSDNLCNRCWPLVKKLRNL